MFLIHLHFNKAYQQDRRATPGGEPSNKTGFYRLSGIIVQKKSILTFPPPQTTLLKMLAVNFVSLMLTDMCRVVC